MNIRISIVATAFLMALLTALPAFADKPSITPEEQFLQLELKWMDALAEKDVAVLEKTLATEFTIIGVGSTAEDAIGTRQEWLEVGLKRSFPKHQVRILKVHQLSKVAVVHGVLTADYPPMPWAPKGGTLSFLITDTWVHRDERWQVVARHSSLPAPSGAP